MLSCGVSQLGLWVLLSKPKAEETKWWTQMEQFGPHEVLKKMEFPTLKNSEKFLRFKL